MPGRRTPSLYEGYQAFTGGWGEREVDHKAPAESAIHCRVQSSMAVDAYLVGCSPEPWSDPIASTQHLACDNQTLNLIRTFIDLV